MKEDWKWIVEYEGYYEVSSHGHLRSVDRTVEVKKSGYRPFQYDLKGRDLKPILREGYLTITISKDSIPWKTSVARLVAFAFIPNPQNKPQVNHIDGNRTNNNVSNLEWATAVENILHAHRTGLAQNPVGEKHGMAKLSAEEVSEIRKLKGTMTQVEIGKRFGVTGSTVSDIHRFKHWKL